MKPSHKVVLVIVLVLLFPAILYFSWLGEGARVFPFLPVLSFPGTGLSFYVVFVGAILIGFCVLVYRLIKFRDT